MDSVNVALIPNKAGWKQYATLYTKVRCNFILNM